MNPFRIRPNWIFQRPAWIVMASGCFCVFFSCLAPAGVAENDPYPRVYGKNFNTASGTGVAVETNADAKGGAWVALGKADDWIKYSKMKFGQGVLSVSLIGGATEADAAPRDVEIWIDGVSAPTGTKLVTLPLNFLKRGKYQMIQLGDAPDRTDAWERDEKVVAGKDRVKLTLRPSGGCVIEFTPQK